MKINFKEEVLKHKESIIKTISEWVQIESITGNGDGPSKALEYGLKKGKELGFETESFDNNMSGHIYWGNKEKYIGILGHVDVVPVNPENWTHPPFEGKVVDEEIWGRGTQDDKGPVVLALYALKILKDLNLDIKLGAKIILGTQEEGGDWSDIEKYFEQNPAPIGGFTPDSQFPLIYAEKGILRVEIKGETNFKNIESFNGGVAVNSVAPSASIKFKMDENELKNKFDDFIKSNKKVKANLNGMIVDFEGVGAHAKNPEKGHSAIWDMVKFINFIEDNTIIKHYIDKHLDDNEAEKIGLKHSAIDGHQTINTGIFNFDGCKFDIVFDLRCPNDVKLEDVEKVMTDTWKKYLVNVTDRTVGLFKDPNDPLIKTLLKSYQDVTGDTKSEIIASGGGTYAKAAPNTVAYGAIIPNRDESRVHQANERVSIEVALTATEVYCNALYELLVNNALK